MCTEALTTAHLILGKRLLTIPDGKVCLNEEDDAPEILNRRAKYLCTLQAQFWKRWKSEYLSELRNHRCGIKNKAGKNVVNTPIKIGMP